MRRQKKYKAFIKTKFKPWDVPFRRIRKFNRPKWIPLKNLLKKFLILKKKHRQVQRKRRKKYVCFKNFFSIQQRRRFWIKRRFHYRDTALVWKQVLLRFDHAISRVLVSLTQKKETRFQVLNFLFKPYYKIDILLWKIGFFRSVYCARQAIYAGRVLVNSKRISAEHMLSCNDIISFIEFPKTAIALKKNRNRFINNYRQFKFLESDFYLNKFVVFKSISDWGVQDCLSAFRGSFESKYLTKRK